VIGGLSAVGSNIGEESTGPKPGQAILLGSVVAAPWILSGVGGIRWARKCHRLVEERKLATGGSGR